MHEAHARPETYPKLSAQHRAIELIPIETVTDLRLGMAFIA